MVEKIASQQYIPTSKITPLAKNQVLNTAMNKEYEETVNKDQGQEADYSLENVDKDKMKKIVKGLNDFLQPSQTSLKFELHEKLNEYYVQIIDGNTHEVVKEIPPKKMLDIYVAMMENIGLIVDEKI